MSGKEIRIERIINRNTGNTVIIPMDHGVSSGATKGLINLKRSIGRVADGGAACGAGRTCGCRRLPRARNRPAVDGDGGGLGIRQGMRSALCTVERGTKTDPPFL